MALCVEQEVIEIGSSSDDEETPVKNELTTTDGKALLDKFMSVCKPLVKINQQKAIIKLLKDKFSVARKEYTQSDEFRIMIEQHISELQSKKKSVYIHIHDVKTILSKVSDTCRPKLKTLSLKEDVETQLPTDETRNDAEPDEKHVEGQQGGGSADLEMTCETISCADPIGDLTTLPSEDDQCEADIEKTDGDLAGGNNDQDAGLSTSLNITVDGVDETRVKDEGSSMKNLQSDQKKRKKDKGKGSQKQIRKLERMLGRINKAIKRLEERELTLDEMDESDSTHIQEYQLRNRFMKVYNMLCKKKESSTSTGRIIEKKIHYEGTRFPEINKRLERLINKKDFFPDFQDVHRVVYKTNLKKDLGLDKRRVNSIAQESFEDVGRKLQKRRQREFFFNFSAHSTIDLSSARDPANNDPELKRKLMENKSIASQKIKEVDEPFVKRQEEYEKSGIVLEAAEHSASDVASDGPLDKDDEEDEPALKKRKVDHDGQDEKQEENGSDCKKDIEKEERPMQTMNSLNTEPSNNDVIPVQHQHNFKDQLIHQEHLHIHAPEMNTPKGNLLPSHLSDVCNGVRIADHSQFNSSPSIVFKPANASSRNKWFNSVGSQSLQTGTIKSTISSQCMQSPSHSCYTTEPVKAFNVPKPAVTSPLMITNVCSLSQDFKHHQGPRGTWNQGETVALKKRIRGLDIDNKKRQKIMMLQSSIKKVTLQTSAPITMCIDDLEMEHRSESLCTRSTSTKESGSCSPSSTQPELDVHVVPDVQTITLASRKRSRDWNTEQLHDTTTNDQVVKKVVVSDYKQNTKRSRRQLVYKTSSNCDSVQFNQQGQTWSKVTEQKCAQFCIQSTFVSNSGSHLQKSTARHNLQTRIPNPSAAAAAAAAAAVPSPPQVPPKDVQNASCNNEYTMLSVKKQPMTPPKITISSHNKFKKTHFPKWQLGQQLHVSRPSLIGKQDNSASDVVIISDSEESENDDVCHIPPVSPDIICISDSD